MRDERGTKFDPNKPALLVKYGNTSKKRRTLDKEVVVLGRAAGCDIGLESPDVAPIHAVIVRAADGWRIRDCSGRLATRLNGKTVHDEPLADEDVIQIGAFSFDVYLPQSQWGPAGGAPMAAAIDVPVDLARANRSRSNFARLALRLRRRIAQLRLEIAESEAKTSERQQELELQSRSLRELRRDLDSRITELKQTASGASRRAAKDPPRADSKPQVGAARFEAGPTPAAACPDPAALQGERRREELNHFARHLQRLREQLTEEQQRVAAERLAWTHEHSAAEERDAARRAENHWEEVRLREQRAEVVRLMGELRQSHQDKKGSDESVVQGLRLEIERLRKEIQEREQRLAAAAEAAAQEAGRWRQETERLGEQLKATATLQNGTARGTPVTDGPNFLGAMKAEARRREALIERLSSLLEEAIRDDDEDLSATEAAWGQVASELESGRKDLEERVRQLRERHAGTLRAARTAKERTAAERARRAAKRAELRKRTDGLRAEKGRHRTTPEEAEASTDFLEETRAAPDLNQAPVGVGESAE
jgi:DNA repair exonuclease SbcCD ATPase subunit